MSAVNQTVAWDLTKAGGDVVDWQQGYVLDDRPVARAFGVNLRARQSDLLDIAMAAYVADRRTRRWALLGKRDMFGFSWARRLHLRVPVREPAFWSDTTVLTPLTELLEWLTDDAWSLEFVARHTPGRPAETQGHLFSSLPRSPAAAALFSGGLDSLAGAARDLDGPSLNELVLVTVRTNSRMEAAQRQLLRELRSRSGGRVTSVIVPLGLVDAPDPSQLESTQRTRGFVFLVVGFVTATAGSLNELRSYENGVGAINLPYSAAQIGAKSSRGAHPATLGSASRLFSLVNGKAFTVVGSNLDRTKGELCAGISPDFRDLVGHTFSCDTAFTQRIRGSTACGICTSCLLRRQALWSAGMGDLDPGDRYRWDVLKEDAASQDTFPLQTMLMQAACIDRCLRSEGPWQALVREFPAVLSVPGAEAGRPGAREAIISLLRRYVDEWCRVPSSVVSRYLHGTREIEANKL